MARKRRVPRALRQLGRNEPWQLTRLTALFEQSPFSAAPRSAMQAPAYSPASTRPGANPAVHQELARARTTLVSSDVCATSREPLSPPIATTLRPLTAAEKRRKRLKVGIADFVQEQLALGGIESVFLGEIDFATDDVDKTRGAIERFWHVYYDMYGPGRRFWWAELQERGMPHYHFILINPPWQLAREWYAFYKLANPLGRHQPKPNWRTRDWFEKDAGRYVGKYANKMAGPYARKARQQLYEFLPSWLRTFGTCQHEWIVADMRAHRDFYDGAAEIRLGGPDGRTVDWYCDTIVRHHGSPTSCSRSWRRARRPRRPVDHLLSAGKPRRGRKANIRPGAVP